MSKARAGRRARERGMTLVEIMVVVAILALMAAAVAVYAMSQMDDARVQTTRTDFRQLASALDLYKLKFGRYPNAQEGLHALLEQRVVKEPPLDGWGQPFAYSLDDGEPVLISYGSDGTPGGNGSAADLRFPAKGDRSQ